MNRETVLDGLHRLKPYPTDKDSGVEWLGKIPAHWDVRRIKYVAPIRTSKLEAKPEQVTYLGLEQIESWTGRLLLEDLSETIESVVGSFFAGDVLFGKLRPYLAKAARPEFDGVCTSELLALHPTKQYSSGYLFYCLINAAFIRWLNSLTYGTKMPRVSPDQVGGSSTPLPSLLEQQAIVAFLDRETSKIDALIDKKQRLIELLQEKRIALITHAVTKGLDPNVPMKDTGVEWLGKIPKKWDVVPVYARYDVSLGKMLDAKHITGEHLGHYLRNVDVQWDRINVNDLPQMDFAPYEYERYLLSPGDLLVCEGGEAGRSAIWHGELNTCFYQKAIHRARPLEKSQIPRFLFFLIYAMAKIGVFEASGNPNTINHLTAVQLRRLRVPFPPSLEQLTIVAFLDRETAKIDALVAKTHEAIDRLKEYRTALISAAVTGKIDVRNEDFKNPIELKS